jgi:hypothetical protein
MKNCVSGMAGCMQASDTFDSSCSPKKDLDERRRRILVWQGADRRLRRFVHSEAAKIRGTLQPLHQNAARG